jgi:glycosyltransferase involved in cell wall biosynthesis
LKNIIILEDSSKAKFGGGQKVTIELLRCLFQKYNLFLFDCKKGSIFQNRAKSYVKSCHEFRCYGQIVGGNKSTFSLGFFEIVIFPVTLILNVWILFRFFKVKKLNKNNAIMYAATKKMVILAFFLKKITGTHYIYHAHSVDDRHSFFYMFLDAVYRKASVIICVSELVKTNIGLSSCVRIYNPIDSNALHSKSINNKEKIVVATFSTLIKLKGIDYFMNSFKFLKYKDKVHYWIFGEGQERCLLQKLESKNVILKGFSNNPRDVMLKDIDLIIIPSITEEACPMAPLEAFSFGIPVISTDIGGQAEVVKNNYVGRQVSIKNSKMIAQQVDFFIENKEEYSRYSKNAIDYSENFLFSKFKDKILKVFSKLI